MSEINSLKHNEETVNINFEHDMIASKIREELLKRYTDYRNTIARMSGDAPIQVLCLDKATENILLSNNLSRVNDLFDRDFTEIKGLGITRIGDLTARLDEFFAVL